MIRHTAALSVPCPVCNAPAAHACRVIGGTGYRTRSPHPQRVNAASAVTRDANKAERLARQGDK